MTACKLLSVYCIYILVFECFKSKLLCLGLNELITFKVENLAGEGNLLLFVEVVEKDDRCLSFVIVKAEAYGCIEVSCTVLKSLVVAVEVD